MSEEEIYSFLASSIPSVWTLELLLLLERSASQGRSVEELVRELRSSTTAISQALETLHRAGLTIQNDFGHYYRPASPILGEIVKETAKLYAAKPSSVIKVIVMSHNDSLRIFADSFKLKD